MNVIKSNVLVIIMRVIIMRELACLNAAEDKRNCADSMGEVKEVWGIHFGT